MHRPNIKYYTVVDVIYSSLSVVHINLSQHMQSGVVDLWESRRHTDVTFLIASNQVAAHRVILASQSEYFDRLLFGEMREAHAGAEIKLEDTPLDTFLLLLQYAYSGCLEVKSADMQVRLISQYCSIAN